MPRSSRKTVRTARQWTALAPPERAARDRAFEALRFMRSDGLSLSQAARRAQTTPHTVRMYASPALRRDARGRTVARRTDRLFRRMRALTKRAGPKDLNVRNSDEAAQLARHWNAVQYYLETGNAQPLAAFRRVSVSGHRLETDPAVIDRWARRGELDFEDIYSLTA